MHSASKFLKWLGPKTPLLYHVKICGSKNVGSKDTVDVLAQCRTSNDNSHRQKVHVLEQLNIQTRGLWLLTLVKFISLITQVWLVVVIILLIGCSWPKNQCLFLEFPVKRLALCFASKFCQQENCPTNHLCTLVDIRHTVVWWVSSKYFMNDL